MTIWDETPRPLKLTDVDGVEFEAKKLFSTLSSPGGEYATDEDGKVHVLVRGYREHEQLRDELEAFAQAEQAEAEALSGRERDAE